MSKGKKSDLAAWQRVLVMLKIWQPPHPTKHAEVRDMPRPALPPVSGAHGNRVVAADRPRLVPQRNQEPQPNQEPLPNQEPAGDDKS